MRAFPKVIGACRNSFSADTDVATAEGAKAIADVAVGDRVLAYDEQTGATGSYPVTDVFSHTDEFIVKLTLDDETLETTADHPFYVLLRGWVEAGKLPVGASVRTADGSYGVVAAVAVVRDPQPMYTLTVADAHTFFVGAGAWLVHNACEDAFAPAFRALNEAIQEVGGLSGKQKNRISTMVCAVDTRTGRTTVGIKRSGECFGMCAEDIAVKELGAQPEDVLFTPAYRPRTQELIPVCTRCQTKYKPNQFAPGTEFDP